MEGFCQAERGFIQGKAIGRRLVVAGRGRFGGGVLACWFVGLLALAAPVATTRAAHAWWYTGWSTLAGREGSGALLQAPLQESPGS